MSKVLENLRSLGVKRLVAGGVVFLVTALLIASITFFATRPTMTLLYTGLDPAEAGQVLSALEAMGLKVEASNGGTAVSVPQDQVDRARMSLAEKGLPSTPGIGYELFDKADGFGLTTFMQRVNRLRAMEGELARTISTLNGVEGTRVHLVLPDRESFSKSAPEPTASVVVRMKGGSSLELPQARSIRHLVASAVPGLKATSVTIMDAAGETILTEGDNTAPGNDARSTLESKLRTNIEDILTARLGHGNVRVGIAVEIETARETVRRQNFDPNGRVIRSTQTVEDKQQSSEKNTDTPTTVQQNLPNADLLNGTASDPNSTKFDRNEETVNYEISNEVTERVLEPGDLRKLSVAVLVNGSYAEVDGKQAFTPRSPEEIASLDALVKTAVGYSEKRGDSVKVESLQFADTVSAAGTEADMTATELLAKNSGQIIMWVLIALLAVVLLFFVVRPLVRFITEPRPHQEPSLDIPETTGTHHAAEQRTADPINPTSREALILELHEAVDDHPEEAVAILRAWIQEGSL